MMNRSLSLLPLIALCAAPFAASADESKPYSMARSEEFTLKSASGESYRIMVSLPSEPAPEGGYPVAYVLDGDELFPVVTSLLRLQAGTAKGGKHNDIRPGIVVGIGYGETSRRDYDYTPPAPAGPPETYRDGRPYPERKSGGADQFLDFIEKQVKPEIARRHAPNPSKQTLMGNGYGGLFALHVLFNRPELFQAYVASSPSIWWNDKYILSEEKKFITATASKTLHAKLLLTVGDLEQSLTRTEAGWGDDEREEHRLKITRRRMVDNTRELYWRMEAAKVDGLSVEFRSYPGESHKSVVPMAMTHALPFVFPGDSKAAAPTAKHPD